MKKQTRTNVADTTFKDSSDTLRLRNYEIWDIRKTVFPQKFKTCWYNSVYKKKYLTLVKNYWPSLLKSVKE